MLTHVKVFLCALALLVSMGLTAGGDLLAQGPSRGSSSSYRSYGAASRESSWGGSRSFDVVRYLGYLDRNRNRMIEPNELVGGLGERIKGMARENRINLSRPVSIDGLAKAFESRQRDSDRRRSRALATEDDYGRALPLGFGTAGDGQPLIDLEPTLGFGNEAETYAVKIVDADRKTVEERFRRYDSNRDGYLSREELARNRWDDDPLKYDRNRDGRLSQAEMAVRYAQRRLREEEKRREEGKRREEARQRYESRRSGGGDDSRTSRIVQFVFDRYDRNKNGRLEREEWSTMRTSPAEADTNRSGTISRDEYTRWTEKRSSSSPWGRSSSSTTSTRSDSGRSDSSRRDYGRRDSERRDSERRDSKGSDSPRRSYSYSTPHDRLPRGIEQWFIDADADRDGQVALAEFSSSFDAAVVENFRQFDRNGDGMITPAESLAAEAAGVSFGGGSRAPSSSRESQFARSPSQTTEVKTQPTSAKLDPRYVAFYGKLFAQYDVSKDGALVKDEWSKMKNPPEGADANGDGRITKSEFVSWSMRGK